MYIYNIVLFFKRPILEFGPSLPDFVGTALEVLIYSLCSTTKKNTILDYGQVKPF